MDLTGEIKMSKKKLFEGFSEEKQKQYEQEAMRRWGEDRVKQSTRLWNSYSAQKQEQIKQEGGAIYTGLAAHIGDGPQHPQVQALLDRWQQHLRYFYEPSLEVLRGLGNAYNEDPDFNATFTAIHPDLPAFLQKAINFYVDQIESKRQN